MIKKIKAPILFVHGQKDEDVSFEEAKVYFKNCLSPKKLVIVENADHGVRAEKEKRCLNIV